MMQSLGRRYVSYFNSRHRRTGTLWEGRFKSCLVDSVDYVLRRYHYIDLNPVRAHMTDDPESYIWSNSRMHCGRESSLITTHPAYTQLGNTAEKRVNTYGEILLEPLTEDLLEEIRAYLQQQRALGSSQFQAIIQAKPQRFAGIRPPHRPPRNK